MQVIVKPKLKRIEERLQHKMKRRRRKITWEILKRKMHRRNAKETNSSTDYKTNNHY